MSFLPTLFAPRPDFPVKAAHLGAWAVAKASVWLAVGLLWLVLGDFPWRTALVGEIIVYAPIPIYFAWVGWTLYRRARLARANPA